MSLTITSPSFDRVYTMYAWRDNNIRLVLTQGEGLTASDGTVAHVKAPKFQLRDERGVIDLTSCEVSLALTRPDGSEDLLACSSASGEAAQGIISCPITASATAIAGQATGEIRVLSADNSNPVGIIKFFGVHFQIHKGVSDAAVAQSMQYSELIEALRKVVSLQTGNVADMDELNNGNLPNGNNPVASGNLKTYLEGNYLTYLGARFAKFTYAHDTHSSGYDADTNPVDVYGDGGVYIDEATDLGTFYIIKNLNGAAVGFLLCASAYGYNRGTQIAVYSDSRFLYRYRHSDGTWDENWSTVELQSNKDSYNSSDTTYFGISNDNTKYPNSKSVYQFIHANAQALVDVYKAIADGVLLGYDTLTIDREFNFNIEKQKIQEYIKLSGVAPEAGHEDEIPSGYTAEDYKNYAADTGYEKSVFDLGSGTYSIEVHGRPNKAKVTIPTGGVYLKYKDTVTGREWVEPIGMLTTPDTYIQNLIPNHIYVYQILDANYAVLKTGAAKGTGKIRMINAGGDTHNIRDIGGWDADGGTLKYGVVYRGAELNKGISITSAQQEFFRNALGIRDEIDLRDSSALAYTGSTSLGVGVDYLYQEIQYGVTAFTQSYYYATANVIKRIAQDIRSSKPVYIHCQAGADRTGLICLFLEAICGVAQSDIDREYELTTFSKEPGADSQWGTHIKRFRNSSASYHLKRLVTEINGMEGSSFNDKVVRHLLRTGVTIDEINDIRFGLIDGNPTKLSNPYSEATVTTDLAHVFIDNEATSVQLHQPFEANLTVEDWYKLDYTSTTSYQITMGGTDITSNCANGKIRIARVTGNISITAKAADNEARIEGEISDLDDRVGGKISDLDDRFELQSTVGFNGNGIPVFVSNNTSFSAGACQEAGVETLFIASNVTTISGGAFNTNANQDITTVYIDNEQTDITVQSGAFPSGATVYYKGQFNALGYVIAALQNLNTSKSDNAKKMSVTVQTTDWSSNSYDITSLMPASADENTKVDAMVSSTVQQQLVADGCGGIYVSTDTSNSTTTFTMHALYNTPTANITVQLILTQLVSI